MNIQQLVLYTKNIKSYKHKHFWYICIQSIMVYIYIMVYMTLVYIIHAASHAKA